MIHISVVLSQSLIETKSDEWFLLEKITIFPRIPICVVVPPYSCFSSIGLNTFCHFMHLKPNSIASAEINVNHVCSHFLLRYSPFPHTYDVRTYVILFSRPGIWTCFEVAHSVPQRSPVELVSINKFLIGARIFQFVLYKSIIQFVIACVDAMVSIEDVIGGYITLQRTMLLFHI